MFVSVLRANETLRKLHGSNQKLAPQYQQMSQYYTQQCKALENISKDTLFKDLDAELKIAPPSLAVLQTFGPRAWAQDWIQALPRTLCLSFITSSLANVIQLSFVRLLLKRWNNGRNLETSRHMSFGRDGETFRSENGTRALKGTYTLSERH